MIPLLGFMPDFDQTTAGVMLEVENIIPTTNGFKALPTLIDTGIDPLPEVPNKLRELEKLNGTKRFFAGTQTKLYELTLVGYIEQGSGYTCDPDDRWTFAQFGDYTLAAQKGNPIQVSAGTTFSSISGAPNAGFIDVSDGFIMAVNTGTSTDQWHCSAYQDYTDWTEAVSTQCTSGRLIGGGALTGVKALGSGFVAFKKRSMYVATYVGAPIVWQWQEIEGDIGCVSGHATVDIGDKIAFMGHDDFYVFDGARNVSIGEGVREWFFQNSNKDFLYRTIATYDAILGNIGFHYCSSNNTSGDPDKTLIYNVRSGKWGIYSLGITAAASVLQDSIIYDDFGTQFGGGTYDQLPTDLQYDYYLNRGSVVYALTDGSLYTLSGTAGTSSFTLNVFGDDEKFTTITRVRPRFQVAPQTSTLTYSYDNDYGDLFTEQGTYTLANARYDLLNSARWHKIKLNFNGNMEISHVGVTITEDGTQ